MLPIASASTVEAVEANIEASRIVLVKESTLGIIWGKVRGEALTIESKHCVQSSR
jgi:hypothetical protein